MKGYFTYERFDSSNKLVFSCVILHDFSYSKLKCSNHLDKEYDDFGKLLIFGLNEMQFMKKFGLKSKPPTGLENYKYLTAI